MVISIRGDRYWLWRALDNEGEVLEFLDKRRRNAKVARKLMLKLLKKYGFAPTRIVTDRLRSYPAAFRAMGLSAGLHTARTCSYLAGHPDTDVPSTRIGHRAHLTAGS